MGTCTTLNRSRPRSPPRLSESRGLLTFLLLGAFVWSLSEVDWGGPLVHPGGAAAFRQLLGAMLTPELSVSFLRIGVLAAWQTVAYAVAGISLAVALGLPLGVVASGVLVQSERMRRPLVAGTRLLLALVRSIHELVWAWLFVVAIGLTPMAAILALAIPYGGIVGRIYAEILQDVPAQPLRALRAAGASEWHVLLYGRLPMALPDMLSYAFYRFECAIRAVTIMSFVGIGGLGYHVLLALHDLRYSEVWTLLFILITLIEVVDMWSFAVRRWLVS